MPLKEMTEQEERNLTSWMRAKNGTDGINFDLVHSVGFVNEMTQAHTLIDEYIVAGVSSPGVLVFYTDLKDRMRLNRLICSISVAQIIENEGIISFSGPVNKDQVKDVLPSQAKLLKLWVNSDNISKQ